MNGISSWLRQFSSKLSALLRGFMAGRYGTDRLNMVILCAGLVASLLSVWTQSRGLNLVFFLLSYGLMIWAIFRSLSRNTYKRYLENRKFLQLINRVKDRQNRYFDCPKCARWCGFPGARGKSPLPAPGARKNLSGKRKQ